ncbi:YjcZ family sporulation protein [Alteribacter natronophilus]|uniref:YjcZ family sporulation protein n=1 Tax=Alteribacter natronophilus TaxID=2583810 RepID=UPI003F67D0B1
MRGSPLLWKGTCPGPSCPQSTVQPSRAGEIIYPTRDKRPHNDRAFQYYVWNDEKEGTMSYSYDSGFVLLVVLFILLVIIGAVWGY